MEPVAAKLLGVVLCGGESRRMGCDKGLLQTDGVPWAIRMGEKLIPWSIPVVYSINTKQLDAYSAILSPEVLITDTLGLPGPLNGLFSIHERNPGRDLLLLACDMQDIDEATIGKLIDLYLAGRNTPISSGSREDGSAFYIYRDDHFLQPFCGIYTAAALEPVHRLARAGGLKDFSLQALLRTGKTCVLDMTDPYAFRNYNTKGP